MLRLTICLLFGTAAFAQYQTGDAPSSFPMDLNDNIYNRDMKRPPLDRLFFNFEQRRIDQPPQYETRDENLGQYMGRPRTTPQPIPLRHDERPLHVPGIDTMHRGPVSTVPPEQWGPVAAHLPSTLPDAPQMPKWMDLSDDSFRNHVRHQPSRHTTEYYQQTVPTQAPAAQWNEPARQSYNAESSQQYQAYPQTFSGVDAYRTPETYAKSKPVDNRQPMSAEEFVRPKARGSHKFSWADVNTPQPTVMSTTAAPFSPQKGRNPPPSIPTLSPWHDGFGK